MIYVVESVSGSYEDYRTIPLFYSADKKKAQKWCENALQHARAQDEKREKIMRKLSEVPEDDNDAWTKLYDRSEKIKSKYDKSLSPSNLSDVSYRVVALKELK